MTTKNNEIEESKKASFGVNAEIPDPVDTGNPSANRPLDKKNGEATNIDQPTPPEAAPTKSGPVKRPADKIGMVKEMMSALAALDKDALGEIYDEMFAESEAIEEAKVADLVRDDLDALFADEQFNEEFKVKAFPIFEAAVLTKIAEKTAALEEAFEARLEEEVAGIAEAVTDRIDAYLDHVINEWVEENKIALEAGIRTEMAESFMNGLKNLFTENNVVLPEEAVDVVETLSQRVEALEKELSETVTENADLKKIIDGNTVDTVFDEVVEGLTDSQKDKLGTLAEGIDYKNVDEFRSKLTTIKESYFKVQKTAEQIEQSLNEEVSEVEKGVVLDPTMASYVAALSRTLKR